LRSPLPDGLLAPLTQAQGPAIIVVVDQRLGTRAAPGDDPLAFWSDSPAFSERLRQLDATAAHNI
jgi:hypothetical protein